MEKIYEWIAKHVVWTVTIIFAIFFVLPLVIVHVLYRPRGICWLITDWESGDLLAFIAGFEAFAGAFLLGIMTLRQNKIFKEENDKSQDRLQKISEGQAKALEQILLMDQSSNIPLVDIKKSTKGDAYVNVELLTKKDCTAGSLKLFLTNITEYPIKDIHVHKSILTAFALDRFINDKYGGDVGKTEIPLEIRRF